MPNLPVQQRLADGSYRSQVYPSDQARRRGRGSLPVRVIEYQLEGLEHSEPLYPLITTGLDPQDAPAQELAALYHERWEIETAFDELETHLRGARIVLRGKDPELVHQELYGLLLAHFAVRSLMREAALRADRDPDALSFVRAVRVIRSKLPAAAILPSRPDPRPRPL
jgi:IS4 transposase